MTRIGGGALAAVGVIALGIAPFVRYTGTWYRAALPKQAAAPITRPKAPSATSAVASVTPLKTTQTKAKPDCAPKPGRSRKEVKLVDDTMTNKTTKPLTDCSSPPAPRTAGRD